jgi:UDP-N-acetylglucosamine 1-carboxyvinyltransferase
MEITVKATKLSGEVSCSGSKNAILPILAATLLTKNTTLINVPNLKDVHTMVKLFNNLGMKASFQNGTVFLGGDVQSYEATYDLVKTMRASILVLGPLLARYGEASVSLPGGCAIGTRPIDIHLFGLEKMGAKIELKSGYVKASCKKLIGADIVLPFPSVGATENLMCAATYAQGTTVLKNVVRHYQLF